MCHYLSLDIRSYLINLLTKLLAAAKGSLAMFEKQMMREREEEDAIEDLRVAIYRLKEDASMYEILMNTMIAPEMEHQSSVDLCNR
jgi:hypothetical protein